MVDGSSLISSPLVTAESEQDMSGIKPFDVLVITEEITGTYIQSLVLQTIYL